MKDRIQQLEKELALAKDALQTVECGIHELKDSEQELEEGQYRFCSTNKEAYRINKKVDHYRYEILWLCKMDRIDNTEEVNKISMEGDRILPDDEIKEALIAEAKRRGFRVGVRIDSTNVGFPEQDNVTIEKDSNWAGFIYERDRLLLEGWIVYSNGNWAEPVEDTVTINGERLTILDHDIEFECGERIHLDDFLPFLDLVRNYDLTVYRQGEDITPQIEKLGEQI